MKGGSVGRYVGREGGSVGREVGSVLYCREEGM